jgi:hypothetical protein
VNHWPFIVGAYAITILATLALVVASYVGMREAEADADALRGER